MDVVRRPIEPRVVERRPIAQRFISEFEPRGLSGLCLPPVVKETVRRRTFTRTPGRIRKLFR
jgi:hypothetical protein